MPVVIASIPLCLGLVGVPVAAQAPPFLATPTLVRYEDAIGDTAEGIGPDIVAVTLTAPDPGSVTIAIEFATDPPLTYDQAAGWTDMLMILGGMGPDGVVQLPDGTFDADFATGLHGIGLEQAVAEGAPLNLDDVMDPDAVATTVEGSTTTLTLTRASLGDPERILFVMWTVREGVSDGETGGGDAFPDGGPEGSFLQVPWTFPVGA
jgi:hypothetical protein